jgi:Bacterial CdiA-CT RNAse A domain
MKLSLQTAASSLIALSLFGVPVAFQLVTTNPVSSAMTCTFNLQSNEGGIHNGHTIARHVNQSDSQLKLRLTNNPDLEAVSTYASLAQAQSLTDSTVCSDKARLDTWLAEKGRKDGDRLIFKKTFTSVTGTIMQADGKTKIDASGTLVVVQRNAAMPEKVGIVTSYPQ